MIRARVLLPWLSWAMALSFTTSLVAVGCSGSDASYIPPADDVSKDRADRGQGKSPGDRASDAGRDGEAALEQSFDNPRGDETVRPSDEYFSRGDGGH